MRARLGDIIDDYCVKCKRIMNHSVVSCLNDEPAKVRCRTCHGDHDYRHETAPPTKADLRKAALYKEVLDRMGRGEEPAGAEGATAEPAVDEAVDVEASAEAEAVAAEPAKVKRAKARK
jgi:cytochrome c553